VVQLRWQFGALRVTTSSAYPYACTATTGIATRVPTPCAHPASASAGRAPPPPNAGKAGAPTPGADADGSGAPLTADGRGAAASSGKPGVALGDDPASSASGTRYAPAVPAAPMSRTAMMAGTSRRPVGRLAQA
jgi:hypothetical protein